jgi:hypothetical protein
MRGVERDGGIDVVDHIAHVDRVFEHVPLTSGLAIFDDVEQELDPGHDLVGDSRGRRIAGSLA